jgi:hypothetical protein
MEFRAQRPPVDPNRTYPIRQWVCCVNAEKILTPNFRQWAGAAGFNITDSTRDGRALVWANGGEDRSFMSAEGDGWWAVDSSDRMGPEQFDWAAAHPGLIERRFIATFVARVRARRGMAAIRMPGKADQLPSGMTLGHRQFRGVDYPALIDVDGNALAVSSGGRLISSIRLVQLSILAIHDVDTIVSSSLDPQGAPLFSLR